MNTRYAAAIPIGAVIALGAFIGLQSVPRAAVQPLSTPELAASSPCAAIFMEMAVRGGIDFFNAERRAPADINEVIRSGMTAYMLPSGADFAYQIGEEGIKAVSYNQPVTIELANYPRRIIGRSFPKPGLWHETKLPAEQGRPGMEFKVSNFDGAQYLEEGLPLSELPAVLQRKHAAIHIARATLEFLAAVEYKRMPQDLAEVESYIGVPRNPAAWQDLQVVDSFAAVQVSAGNLYFGPVNRTEWQVIVNLGPELEHYKFAYDKTKPKGWYLASQLGY